MNAASEKARTLIAALHSEAWFDATHSSGIAWKYRIALTEYIVLLEAVADAARKAKDALLELTPNDPDADAAAWSIASDLDSAIAPLDATAKPEGGGE